MEKVVHNSKFLRHSTEIIRQSKIKGPLIKDSLCELVDYFLKALITENWCSFAILLSKYFCTDKSPELALS